jgi:serine/threonine-protein kinase
MTTTTLHAPAAPPARAGNDANFAATVVEELFVEAEDAQSDSVPAVDPGADTLQMMPTLSQVGRYELKHQLGSGGWGTVYAALDPLLSRQVAVKMLRVAELDADERSGLESQLLAEARAAAGLAHANIVTVYDAGLASEGVYIAMERLQGKDVRHLLADGWRPDVVQAARIAKRLADALAYAHGKGVVHCDIKPANVFMVGRTQPKVLDFGIARVTRRAKADAVDIDTGILGAARPSEIGSPYYVSPEHLLGHELDARADVYGVGIVLYEMLVGRRPFDGADLDAIRSSVLESDVPPVDQLNRKVDRALAQIVSRAMARKPGDRFRSARQLSRALQVWISEETNGLVHRAAPHRGGAWVWAAGATMTVGLVATVWLLASRESPAGDSPPAVAAPQVETVTPAAKAVAAAPAVEPQVAVEPPAPAVAEPAKPRAADAPAARVAKKDKPVAKPVVAAAEPAPAAPPSMGQLQLAVTPWGQVEVDGRAMGTTPPLARLSLPAGTHEVVVRNGDFPAFTASITVSEDKPVTLRHRFE